MTEELYLLLITVLLLAGLVASLPVLVNILRDGRARWRQRQSGELDYPQDNEEENGGRATLDKEKVMDGTWNCSNCGAENSTDFVYCQDCTERL